MIGRRGTPDARLVRGAGARPGIRRGSARRTRPVRRASAGITPVRAGALLVVLAGLAGLYGLSASSAFTVRHTKVTGATWTPQGTILAALAIPAGQNLFTVSSTQLAQRIDTIPALRGVSVTVSLPDTVTVSVTERQALLVWQAGDHRFLVDETGLLFGELGGSPPAAAASLPVVDDARAASATLALGATLDPVTLDAALRLGSLKPDDIGSSATSLAIRLDDTNGFTVASVPDGWTSVFGFYTPTLRTTDLIPAQVRLLRSLLLGREDKVGLVILADDRSGTYLPRGSGGPGTTATQKPAATPKPTPKPTPRPTSRPTTTAQPSLGPSASPRPSATPKS